MGGCWCSHKENSIVERLKKRTETKEQDLIVVNNTDQSHEKIKIRRKGTHEEMDNTGK
jgi:hypothetical protein